MPSVEKFSWGWGGRGDCRIIGGEGSAVLALAGHHKFSVDCFSLDNPLFDSRASNHWRESGAELPRWLFFPLFVAFWYNLDLFDPCIFSVLLNN